MPGEQAATLATLSTKLDIVIQKLDAMNSTVKNNHDRGLLSKERVEVNVKDITGLGHRIDAVDSARKTEGRITGLVIAALSAFGQAVSFLCAHRRIWYWGFSLTRLAR